MVTASPGGEGSVDTRRPWPTTAESVHGRAPEYWEELMEYDPALYALIAEFLPDEPQFVDCYSDE